MPNINLFSIIKQAPKVPAKSEALCDILLVTDFQLKCVFDPSLYCRTILGLCWRIFNLYIPTYPSLYLLQW